MTLNPSSRKARATSGARCSSTYIGGSLFATSGAPSKRESNLLGRDLVREPQQSFRDESVTLRSLRFPSEATSDRRQGSLPGGSDIVRVLERTLLVRTRVNAASTG